MATGTGVVPAVVVATSVVREAQVRAVVVKADGHGVDDALAVVLAVGALV